MAKREKVVRASVTAWAMWHPWKNRPFVGLDSKRGVRAWAIYRSRQEAEKVCEMTHDDAVPVRVRITPIKRKAKR